MKPPQLDCKTQPNTPALSAHVADLYRLRQRAESLGLPGLSLSLALLILEHLSENWRAADVNPR